MILMSNYNYLEDEKSELEFILRVVTLSLFKKRQELWKITSEIENTNKTMEEVYTEYSEYLEELEELIED